MPLPSVTPAQYRALDCAADGLLAVTDEGQWIWAKWSPSRPRKDVLGRLWVNVWIERGERFEHFPSICRVVLTDLGRQVLAAKRGEG